MFQCRPITDQIGSKTDHVCSEFNLVQNWGKLSMFCFESNDYLSQIMVEKLNDHYFTAFPCGWVGR